VFDNLTYTFAGYVGYGSSFYFASNLLLSEG